MRRSRAGKRHPLPYEGSEIPDVTNFPAPNSPPIIDNAASPSDTTGDSSSNVPTVSDVDFPEASSPPLIPTQSSSVATPTVTVTVASGGSGSAVVSQPTAPTSSTSIALPSSATQSAASLPDTYNGATATKDRQSDTTPTLAPTQPKGMPVGTIVGVIMAILIVLCAIGAYFFFRRRSQQQRMKTRAWANKKMAPSTSFLHFDDREKGIKGPSLNVVAPFASPRVQDFTYPQQPPQVHNGLQPTNNGLPFIPHPAPPRPPPAHGYDYNPDAPTTPIATMEAPSTPKSAATSRLPVSMASVSILSPLTPGTMPQVPTFPSPQPLTNSQLSSPIAFVHPSSPSGAMPAMAKVKATFIPTMPDELTISIGEIVRVKKEYDDGWASCVNVKGEQGMIPLECLDKGNGLAMSKKLARASSLASKSPY
jgi:hypothetical protein